MKVSVLLAVYNGEDYIEQAVHSVLCQSHEDFELLVGFNGTTDNSKKLISEIDDPRIRIFDYGDDKGKSKTLNKLLLESTANWVAIQDADDVWMRDKLKLQIGMVDEFDVIGTFAKYINEYSDFIGEPTLAVDHADIANHCFNYSNQIINCSSLIKKEAIFKAGVWDENCLVEDYDLWLKLLKLGYKFRNIPKPLVWHRIHHKSNFNTQTFDIYSLVNKYK